MFSTRTGWDRRPGRLAALLAARAAAGAETLDLTETNPTRAGLLCPADLLKLLGDELARRYEPEPRGSATARAAVAADYRRRGALVDADDIVLTASTSEAYAFAFKLLSDPGDDVLVPQPSYPLFEYLAGLESVPVRGYPLGYDGQWHLQADSVREAATPRTRAVVVVSPNNPTGSFLKRDEATALLTLCAERGWALISDEVFADFPFDPADSFPVAAAGNPPCLTFSLGGLSKLAGLPGIKLGWILLGGPEAEVEAARAALELIADTYLSVSTPAQLALPALLARGAAFRRALCARLRANRAAIRERLRAAPAVELLDAAGGWYACLRVPRLLAEEELVLRLLDEDGVVVHPGYFFDFASEAYLVLSLIVPEQRLRAGLDRILARFA